ncbi:MAG TPA: succinate dehydrogenase, hydrophobic membrane anchor protein [Nitrosomonas sp.]|nr:succinate dehydrogenase, hydrophobic membrane anchor protein [Nitrosomonas sp.]HMW21555.1 succinate dehydrogenase, hydrophobic membrane anchor protein [Nitrosomonas sp.]HMW69168.1 succinate dehydrogenase, hydrophobic membrane anchor protein [Nitrosomonas sp.]HMY62242.1 succinate dehydrogenase, hydrophobic membrane anchor protein [Nitrosomonas sp.]HMY90640.1 succinate dehydrogenase, hydrophobic membrane anchor protein [Nitrosomonas sp.]
MVARTKRVLTGAHYGLIDWLVQRVTAVLMVLYLLLLAWVFTDQASDYAGLKSIFANQWMRIFSLLVFIGLCWHAWVGVRNVLMDYVKITSIRLSVQVLVITALLFYLIWFVDVLWR